MILNDKSVSIKCVIVPLRDLKESAQSRVRHGRHNGGLWNASDEASQISFYKDILSNYLITSVRHDINNIFLSFDKMIIDKEYLFNKLKDILDEKDISFDKFSSVYDKTSISSRPT